MNKNLFLYIYFFKTSGDKKAKVPFKVTSDYEPIFISPKSTNL